MEMIQSILQQLGRMRWSDYLDIALVAFLIYKLLPLVRTSSAVRIAGVVVAMVVLSAVTGLLELYTINFILNQVMSVGFLALVILFQPELRRMLDHLSGSVRLRSFFSGAKPVAQMDAVISQTVMACETMSREKVGALIVFAREVRLDEYFKTGSLIDGIVSEQLIRNIFFPKAALHDGAMIIRDGKIAAAGCVLPLSDSSHLSADLGTRHRAGVGMSEASDAVVVIVSEETGTISVAVDGMLKRHLAPQTLERLLHTELCPDTASEEENNLAARLRSKLRRGEGRSTMKNKFAAAALSVVIATLLWLYVITTVSPGTKQTFYNIPLVLGNESVLTERGLMITYQSATSVNLELSGTRTDLAKVNAGNITVKADLSNIYEPGNQIAVSYTTSFPGNVANNAFVTESRSPSRIYLNVERRASKTIPVEVKWIGSVPDGFIADRDNKLLEYPTVQITGPESVTNQIEKAVIEVDLADQRESISWDCTYTLCDVNDEPVDAELITTNVDQIHLEVRIQRVKDITLTYHLVEGGGATADNVEITLSTDKIRVSGSEAALDLMGDQLVVGTIDLSEVASDMNKTFTIPLEEGITNLTGISEVTATITLKGLSTKDFLIRQISVVNVPDGLEVELITQELNLRVRGPADQIARLTLGDVMVVVDFTGAEIGTATFPVRAVFTDGFRDVGVLRAESVSASVMEAGTLAEQTEASSEPEAVG